MQLLKLDNTIKECATLDWVVKATLKSGTKA